MRICYEREDDAEYLGLCVVQLRLDTSYSSPNASFGRFHLEAKGFYANPAWDNNTLEPEYVNFISETHRALAIRECLDWDDVDALDRNKPLDMIDDGYHASRVLFKPDPKDNLEGCLRYVNDVEIPEMSYHLHTFSRSAVSLKGVQCEKQGYVNLNWKSLLTGFFAEEIFVRRKLRDGGARKTPLLTLRSLFDRSMTAIAWRCPSLKRLEQGYRISEGDKQCYESSRKGFTKTALELYVSPSSHQSVYQAAYAARLHKAFAKTGLDLLPKAGNGFKINRSKYKLKLEEHVDAMQKYREDGFKAYLDKYWLYKVGKVVFEELPAEDDSDDDESDEDGDSDHDSDRNHNVLYNDDDYDYEYDPYNDNDRLSEDFSVKDWKPLKKRELQPQSKKTLKKHKKGKWKW
jgi:hypothetical protein